LILSLAIALVVFLVFKYVPKFKELEVDGFMSVTFVLVPAIVSWLVGLALSEESIIHIALLFLYLVVPAAILQKAYNLSWSSALGYGGVVFGIVVLSQIALILSIGVPSE